MRAPHVEARDDRTDRARGEVQHARHVRRHLHLHRADPFRVTRDRVPKVAVGSRRKAYSGGASSIQIRYGTVVGPYRTGNRGERSDKMQTWARSVSPGWTDAAARDYTPPAFQAWDRAVEHIVNKWNRG